MFFIVCGRLGVRSPLRYAAVLPADGLSAVAACVACLPASPCLSLRARHIGRPVRPVDCCRSSEQGGGRKKKGEALVVHVASRLTVCKLPGLQALHAHALPAPLAPHTPRVRGSWQVPLQVQVLKFLLSVEPAGHALT